MVPVEDPYVLLAVPRSATQDHVRRAYKKACLRWHPDKHPPGAQRTDAERTFKAICRAYNTLSDPSARRVYDVLHPDQSTMNGLPQQRGNSFFDSFCSGGDSGGGLAEEVGDFEKPPDKEVDLAITLEEFYLGCVKKRRLRTGVPVSGEEHPVLTIAVRPGYRPGDRVRFRDATMDVPCGLPADVVFVISQKPHARFAPDGDDLRMTMRINLVDALAGAVLIIRALDGTDVKVRVDNVIYPGYVHRIEGAGMPRRRCPQEKGSLFVAFEIMFPKRIEADDRGAVRELFARLEVHSKNRMSVRRSSSLFTSRQTGANILNHRRASACNGMGAKVGEDDSPPSEEAESANNARPSAKKNARSKLRFSIFG